LVQSASGPGGAKFECQLPVARVARGGVNGDAPVAGDLIATWAAAPKP
jgi:hypothetical protein